MVLHGPKNSGRAKYDILGVEEVISRKICIGNKPRAPPFRRRNTIHGEQWRVSTF
jgi:hypothetical protein